MFRILIQKWRWYFNQIPTRFQRILGHFNPQKWHFAYFSRPLFMLRWGTELLLLLIDLFGLSEFLESITLLIKFNSRPLSDRERAICSDIFGKHLNFDVISIDESAFFGPRQFRFAYVQMNTINYWGKMTDRHFVHELVHVWQYQKFGLVYALRALIAQKSKRGYHYGSEQLVAEILKRRKPVSLFNYEQQADIIADYYIKKYVRREEGTTTETYALYLQKLLASAS